jgi:hypothetical protein
MGHTTGDAGEVFDQALRSAGAAIAYSVSRELAALYPGRLMLEGDARGFELEEYVAAGLCTAQSRPDICSRINTTWAGPGQGLTHRAENAWFEVSWQGHRFEVLLLTWTDGIHRCRSYWILADARELAERFFEAVCEWCAEVRGEVLVFEGGGWHKSSELFQSIQDATFENLILHGSLKRQLQEDLNQFFASRELYEEYHVPWKRGILFVGPPGNGKTHAVKALVNSLHQPCLYVKSFRAERRTDEDNIREVFRRARLMAPCLLVLEDLDSLITPENRSYFLNELDGFAANVGIVALATTNHPERLDPAILERPSRFDRKYPFDLPGPAERTSYLRMWNDTLQEALRLSEPEIAHLVELTFGFSFAYMKELVLSSTMRWIAWPQPGGMIMFMTAQAMALREQMSSLRDGSPDEKEDEPRARQIVPSGARRARPRRR